MAAVFIVKLAIESGWLTPARQWGVLSVLGFILAGAGRLYDKIDRNYRTYLSAGGVVVLFIAAVSSYAVFDLVSLPASYVLTLAVSSLCLYLFHFHRSEVFTILAVVGTYVSPLLLNTQQDLVGQSVYFLIWAALFSAFSIHFGSRPLALLAAYFGIGVYAMMGVTASEQRELLFILGTIFLQALTFAAGVVQFSIRTKTPLTRQQALSYLPALLFYYGVSYFFLDRLSPAWAPWISLGFSAVIFVMYRLARNRLDGLESAVLMESFFSVVLFHAGYLQILPDASKPWLLPLLMLGVYVGEQRARFGNLSVITKLAFSVVGCIEFLKICAQLVSGGSLENVVVAAAVVGVGTFYYLQGGKAVKKVEGIFFALIHTLVVLALYRVTEESGSFAVSLSWGLYSTLVLVYGYSKKNVSLALSSLLVLTITCLKALFWDASQASSWAGIASLIFTGGILYGAGYLFRLINEWPKTQENDLED